MLRVFRFWTRVVFHLGRPFQEAQQLFSFAKQKSPEFEEADFVHLQAAIGFHAPAKIGASPGREMVSTGCVPQKTEHTAHDVYEYNRWGGC